jgi:aminoglycoside N3'-acetyltransferase
MVFTKDQLIKDLQQAGIKKGDLLHLKVSLKSIGKIEGGAETLLQALLDTVGAEGTLVIDSFVSSYPLPLSNDNAAKISTVNSPSYAGALANTMIKHPESVRSKHPIQRFTAIGAMAEKLMLEHTSKSGGYDVLNRMAEMGGKNLTIGKKTIGVGTTHVAIEKMGFRKKRANMGVNYLDENGNTSLFEVNWNGGCGRGFPKFIPLYIQNGDGKKVKVGNAECLLTDMKRTLQTEMNKLQEDPTFFFCDDPTCKDCRLNWEHSTGNLVTVKYHSLFSIIKKALKR